MAGIYYNPEVWNWGGKLAEGGLAGMAFAKGMQDVQSNKRKMDMEKRIDAANAEIGDLYKEAQGKLQGMPKIEAIPENANEGITSMAKSPALAEQSVAGGTEEGTGLARAAQLKDVEGNKAKREQAVQAKTEIMADLSRKRHDIYLKHNLPELADKIRTQHVAEAAALGKNVSEKVAFNYLKKGPLADMMEGVTEKDFSKDGDKWHITFKDGNTYSYNEKTGETKIEEGTHAKEKEDKPPTTRDFQEGRSKVTKQWNPETKTWDELSRGPMDKPESGSKSEAKKEWTKGDVRQEYNNLNTYLNKAEADIAKRLEEEGEDTGLKAQLEKIRKIRTGLMKYRSDDMWSVSDPKSSERGKYPRNLQKIEDYLAGFGDQGEQKKDITQEKPTTGKKNRPDLNSYYKTGG